MVGITRSKVIFWHFLWNVFTHMEEGGERGEEEATVPLSKSRDPHLAGQCRKLFAHIFKGW
jgi:hypothetical protein